MKKILVVSEKRFRVLNKKSIVIRDWDTIGKRDDNKCP